jgi:glycosyltransferase involved in cell wall biosynthesis
VALLEADAEHYRQLGVARERVVTAGSCSDGVRASSLSMRARHEIDGPLVVFLGVRRAYKGADLLLRAAPVAARSVPGLTVAFVGPGKPLHPPPGIRVIDAGEVSDDERAAWLQAADVMCLPSAAEIFPLTILEAWSVGTPVVVSDIEPLRELIAMSDGGISTSREPSAIAEALVTLLQREDRGRALGERGRALWSARFTTKAIVARHEEIYEAVLDR